MAVRDAYHSKALAELSPMTSSLSQSNFRMLPIFRIRLNIQNGGTWRISFQSPRRDESDDVITSPIEPPDVADFLYLIKYLKWRHVTHIIQKHLPSWVRWRNHFPHRTSGCRRFFFIWLNIQNGGTRRISFERPGRDDSDDVITFRIEPPDVADFSYLIKYSKWRYVTHIIRKPSQRRVWWLHHFPPSNLRMSPIFRISLNIKNEGTWPISFESPCRAESDDVITFRIEPRDVADFSYLFKYSKWRDVTHIIRKPSPIWVR